MADTRGIRAGRAFVELGVSDKLSAGLRRAQKRLQAFGAGLRSVGTKMSAMGVAILAPPVASAKLFAHVGDKLDKMSARTGVSTEALSELGFAAEQSGADLEILETGLRKMQKIVGDAADGTSTAVDALSRLGLTVEFLAHLSPEQQFKLISDRLSQIADPTLRAAAAMEVFGKSGTRLLPMIQDGAAGIEELQQQARSLGLTVSQETAHDAAVLNDTLNILWRVLKQGVFVIGSALAPVVVELSESITKAVVTVTSWIKQNRELVVWAAKIAAGIVAAGLAFVAAGYAVSAIATALGGLAAVVSGVGIAFGMVMSILSAIISPIGLVISAVVILGATLFDLSDYGGKALAWLSDRFKSLKESVTKVMGGIVDALKAGDITLVADILWKALKVAWLRGANELNKIWLSVKQFFVSTAHELWYGFLDAYELAAGKLKTWWADLAKWMAKVWESDFFRGVRKGLWDLIGSLAKVVVPFEFIGQGLSREERLKRIAEAERQIDEETAGKQKEIDDGRADRLAEIDAEHKKRLAEIESERDANLVTLSRRLWDAQEALKAAHAEDFASAEAELQAAQAALNEAIAKAKTEREQAQKEGGPPGPPRRPPTGLDDWFTRAGQGLADKAARFSVVGTFNPAAVRGLGGGDAAERTARATERTAKNTGQLVRIVRLEPPSFTGP